MDTVDNGFITVVTVPIRIQVFDIEILQVGVDKLEVTAAQHTLFNAAKPIATFELYVFCAG